MAEILVRGEAELRCLPDRAVVRVVVDGEGSTQEEAYAVASKSASEVDSVLDAYASAIDRRITAGVVVQPTTRWKNGETITTGWRASRWTMLEVVDFAKLGRLLGELPMAGASSITGPTWQVDPGNAVHHDARQRAAEEAHRRAAAYAEALSVKLGALSWLSEPGLRLAGGQAAIVHAMAGTLTSARASSAEEEPMDVSPDEVTVRASVEACFEVVTGD